MPPESVRASTIIHILVAQERRVPEKVAFAQVDRQLEITQQFTYTELLGRVIAGADWLRTVASRGDRVLVFFEPGLPPLIAFLSVLAAGMVAVPAAMPRAVSTAMEARKPGASRRLAAAHNLARDCEPRVVISSAFSLPAVGEMLSKLKAVPYLASIEDFMEATLRSGTDSSLCGPKTRDSNGTCDSMDHLPEPEDIAFLQYTSGSTALPKGVMVTHANLVHNQTGITALIGSGAGGIYVSWLPMFHDMGLVGDAMGAIATGSTCIKLNPADFLRRPAIWMEAVAKFKATVTGAPNFALQIAGTRGLPEGKILDLSNLAACYCGSEPIRASTLEIFAKTFAPHGLRPESLLPSYGLAESTLIVSGCKRADAIYRVADSRSVTATAVFVQKANSSIVSCGRLAYADARLFIGDSDSNEDSTHGHIGEICVTSRSVSPGYWSHHHVGAKLRFPDEERTLRTGDLGFIQDGELYVCGRLKNTLIVRGRKFIAEDLEAALERELSCIERIRVAVFTVGGETGESVIVAVECPPCAVEEEWVLAERVNETLSGDYGFIPQQTKFFRPSTLPRTTSGKLQRQLCAELWERSEGAFKQ